jgi:CRP-like cAMP-binding protein
MALPRGNRLLDALSSADTELLSARASVVRLEPGTVTVIERVRMRTVDFPISALMSVEATLLNGTVHELVSVGTEAFVEIDAALESEIPMRSVQCRFGGDVVRVMIEDFQANLLASRTFARRVRRAVRARIFVTEQNQLCNLKHSIRERLARWMLVARERLEQSHFSVTHEVLGTILGSRRASITEAVGLLEEAGAIERGRGVVQIRDADRLAEAACECYELCRSAIDESVSPEA